VLAVVAAKEGIEVTTGNKKPDQPAANRVGAGDVPRRSALAAFVAYIP
jgi:hypothetical protein